MSQDIETILKTFLNKNCKRGKSWNRQPIIINWMNNPSMKMSLQVIYNKIDYLHNQNGSKRKLTEWFCSDDRNFNTITAERYIIDYLMSKNDNIIDNLKNKGPDAYFNFGKEKVGIEITTLNGFIDEWIFKERLLEILVLKKIVGEETITITYNHKRLIETKGGTIYNYIDRVADAIENNDNQSFKELDISIHKEDRRTGYIAWEHENTDDFPWFKYLTGTLINRISDKSKQLKQYKKNIVFAGVNHMGPINWAIPRIFEEIGCGGFSYIPQIEGIKNFWLKNLLGFPEVIGICYFCYALDKEKPFYPLKVFWRNEIDEIALNL
jgi:hypothetical protein